MGVLGWTERAEERETECWKQKRQKKRGRIDALSMAAVSFSLCSSIALFSTLHSITQTLYV